jgi:hypothetical protein
MAVRTRNGIKLLLVAAIAVTVLGWDTPVMADIHKARMKRTMRTLLQSEMKGSSNTDFSGLWTGTFQLLRTSCSGLPSQLSFRHSIFLSGNRVRIATSHDGTLTGTSRDKGRRIETTRQSVSGGVLVTVGVGYTNLRGNVAAAALAVELRSSSRSCAAIYGAIATRRI